MSEDHKTTVTISLPEALREFIDRRMRTKGYKDAGEYVLALLEQAREREAGERKPEGRDSGHLESLLQASLDDPRSDFRITPEFWHDVKKRFAERIEAGQGGSKK